MNTGQGGRPFNVDDSTVPPTPPAAAVPPGLEPAPPPRDRTVSFADRQGPSARAEERRPRNVGERMLEASEHLHEEVHEEVEAAREEVEKAHEEEERLLDVLRRRLIRLDTMPQSLRLATGFTLAQILAAALLIAIHYLPQPVLTTSWQGGYAVRMPVLAFVVSVVLLVIAWTFLLTGALYAHWSMRFAILAVFTLFVTDQGLLLSPTTFSSTPVLAFAMLAMVLGLWGWFIVALLLSRRAADRGDSVSRQASGIPLRAFAAILLALLGVYGIGYWSYRTSTLPDLFQNMITLQVESVAFFLIPVLFLAGTDFAEWGELMSGRVAHVASRIRLLGGRRSHWPLVIASTLLAGTIAVQVLLAAQLGPSIVAAVAILAPPLALGVGFILALLLIVRAAHVGEWSRLPVPVAALVAAAIVLQGGGMLVSWALSAALAPKAEPVVQDFAVYRHGPQQPLFSLAHPKQWTPKVVVNNESQRVTGLVFDGTATDNRTTFWVFTYPAASEPLNPEQVLKTVICSKCAPTLTALPASGAWQVRLIRAGALIGQAWMGERGGQVWLLYGLAPPETFVATQPVYARIVQSWRPDLSAQVPSAPGGPTAQQRAIQISNNLIGVTNGLVPLVLGLGIGLPLVLRGRRRGGRGAMAGLYFVVVGLLDAVLFLPALLVLAGLPLQHIHFSLPAFQLLVAVATLGVVAWLLAHRPWTGRGAELLTMLFVLNGGLLFISWMFAYFDRTQSVDPRFTVIQALLLVVAEGWDLLMSGEQVTNVEGPESPRHSRVLMYLGYVTVVCTAILFFTAETTASPEPPAGAFFASDAWPQEGVFLLGAPLLITGFALEAGRWWHERGTLAKVDSGVQSKPELAIAVPGSTENATSRAEVRNVSADDPPGPTAS